MTTTQRLGRLPLFPLTGTLLLPGTFLPLNVFEQRYRNLVLDALESDRRIGMIQPRSPLDDNFGPSEGSPERPELYGCGCIGSIVEWTRETDGRYLIVLEGDSRFEVVRELSLHRGYRRVEAQLLEDPEAQGEDVPLAAEILAATIEFCRACEIEIDPHILAALSGWRLVNALSVALPFAPAEKQLLLEAHGAGRRGEVLHRLLGMGSSLAPGAADWSPEIAN